MQERLPPTLMTLTNPQEVEADRVNRVRSHPVKKLAMKFIKDESGATAIEYGLIAALIALAIMVGAGSLGNSLNNQFGRIATKLDGTAG